ncbi:MAG: 30S ribosomal protein S15 [Candidatus Shikimatogenerans sp. AspAUS03]|uniref:30S ribosomal protein S15 n=1 Tax=Candidatus Shikimatogenerans sp. AspAUS03 TaxID=3158563 RepID=A0AAU7QTD1_9FLAO
MKNSFKINIIKYNYLTKIILKINNLNNHLMNNKKDYNSKRTLFILLNKKKKIIKYLTKNNVYKK